MRVAWSLSLFLVLLFRPTSGVRGAEVEPARTYAVIAGVLKWEANRLASFSPRHRKDQELYDVLRARGVPASNLVLLLDQKATRAGIQNALQTLAARAKKGSTFLFYYAGHGALLGDGTVALCSYDHDDANPNKLPLLASDVGKLLGKHFRGERVLLMADCCHSGGLEGAARHLARAGFKAASLTSAESANLSSGNWTFTQAVIDALRGEALADLNGDGRVLLGELAQTVAVEMKYREQQKSGFGAHGFETDFALARTGDTKPVKALPGPFRLREYVLAPDKGTTRVARVVGARGDKITVEFYGYTDKHTAHLPADRLQRVVHKTHKVGEEVQVSWEGQFYRAKILEVKDDFHLVTYPGYAAYWNEWVLSDRIGR